MKYPWTILFHLLLFIGCNTPASNEVMKPSVKIIPIDLQSSIFTWTLKNGYENGSLELDSGHFSLVDSVLSKVTTQSKLMNLSFQLENSIMDSIALLLTMDLQGFTLFDSTMNPSLDTLWAIEQPTHSVTSSLLLQDSLRRISIPVRIIQSKDTTFFMEGKLSTTLNTPNGNKNQELLLGFQLFSANNDKGL